MRISLIALLGWFWPGLALMAENRFPKPEFSTGYVMPQTTTPMPYALPEWSWSLLLLLVLVLTGLVVYRWRSHKGQIALVLGSLLLFGFLRYGCICSVGSLQNIAAAMGDSTFPLNWVTVIFFGLPLLTALFFGRLFCGAACPFGAIQELVHWRTLKVPRLIDRLLRLLPVVYLALAVLLAMSQTAFVICKFDPFVAMFRFNGSWQMVLAGAILLLIGVFISRPYCRYLCPYGVLLRWCAMLSPRKVSISPDTCINCRLCETACPNDAIVYPAAPKQEEPRQQAVKGMKQILGLTPAIVAIGYVAGTILAPWLASFNPDVALYQALQQHAAGGGADATDQVTAFLSTGQSLETLAGRAAEIQRFFWHGGGLAGAFLGLMLVAELVLLSRRNESKEYSVRGSECYCCSRCYAACPVPKKPEKVPDKTEN
jgi:ferredoxin